MEGATKPMLYSVIHKLLSPVITAKMFLLNPLEVSAKLPKEVPLKLKIHDDIISFLFDHNYLKEVFIF